MEEIESLKSTLSVMLQLYLVKMTQNQIQLAEQSLENIQFASENAAEAVESLTWKHGTVNEQWSRRESLRSK